MTPCSVRRCARAPSRSPGCRRCPPGRSPWLAGWAAASPRRVSSPIAFALAAVVAGDSGSAGAIALAAVFGAQAYVAVFLAIGCITKRAAVWSLAFVFIVERLLGANLSGIAQLTPSWVARSAFVGLTDAQESLVARGHPARYRRPHPPLLHLGRRPHPHQHQAPLPPAHRQQRLVVVARLRRPPPLRAGWPPAAGDRRPITRRHDVPRPAQPYDASRGGGWRDSPRSSRLASMAPTMTKPTPATARAATWSSLKTTPSTSDTTGMR